MDTVMLDVARRVLEQVNWQRPGLKELPCAVDWRAGRIEEAALGFVRHLRSRPSPFLGYHREYVAAIRAHATPEYRAEARRTMDRLLGVGVLGGDWPDGRGTLLAVRPEILHVAATREDFDRHAALLVASRDTWGKGAIHTILNLLRHLQAVWPLEECSDASLLPLFAFLTAQMEKEWLWTRTWGEAMLGCTGHNWWIAQHGGTWKAGFLFPEFKGFEQFQAFFPEYVERELRVLMFPDGFTHECSVSYHIGTVDLFLDVVCLAEANGLSLGPAFREHLRRCAEVEWKLMQPDGNYPAFGDCHNMEPLLRKRMRSVAAVCGIPEAKYLAETLDPGWKSPFGPMLIDELYYPSVGEDLRPKYDRIVARPPAGPDTCLPDAGYYAMRQDWTAGADYAAIEASAHGNIVTSHGHSAIFDLKLCSRGRALFVGNGKGPDVGLDNPDRKWRTGCPAHSVATVDGEDHVPLRSVYRFDRVVLPTVDAWESGPNHAYFSGVHEAYERLEKKVPGARRKLFYLRGDYWILIDRFTAAGKEDPHVYRQHFQVDAPCRVLADGRVVTEGAGGNLLFVPVPGACGEAAVEPCPRPLDGYPAPRQVSFTQRAAGHGLFATLLVPFRDEAMPEVSIELLGVAADGRVLSPWEATGLGIRFQGRQDIYVDVHMWWTLPWECGGCQGKERLFHSGIRKSGA